MATANEPHRDLRWEVARDPGEVHALLETSDRAQATAAMPAPRRNRSATEALVGSGGVHLLRCAGRPVAMVTVSERAPFDPSCAAFQPARRPLYMQRLAVDPDVTTGTVIPPGLLAARHAVATARERGADWLRCEANPTITRVVEMLRAVGFSVVPSREDAGVREGGPPRIHLQVRP